MTDSSFCHNGNGYRALISLIIFGHSYVAHPPCFLISEGTRSNAITATAPAFCAISAFLHW